MLFVKYSFMNEYKVLAEFSKEREKTDQNEMRNDEYDSFIRTIAESESKIEYEHLIVLIRILTTRKSQYLDSLLKSGIINKLFCTYNELTTLNEMIFYLQSLNIIISSIENIEIQNIMPPEFLSSLASYFSPSPLPPFSLVSINESEKFDNSALELFFSLMQKFPALRSFFDKTQIIEMFTHFTIRTKSFALFEKSLQYLSSILEKDDAVDAISPLLKVFELLEPYCDEPECKPLLEIASKLCSLNEDCCNAFLSTVSIQQLMIIFTKWFKFPAQMLKLFNNIIVTSDAHAIELIENLDFDCIKCFLTNYASFIDREELIDELMSFLHNMISNEATKSRASMKMYNEDVLQLLIDNNYPFNSLLKGLSTFFHAFSMLDFEKQCEIGDNQEFIDALINLIQGNKHDQLLAINTAIKLRSMIIGIENRLDFSELDEAIEDINSNSEQADEELICISKQYVDDFISNDDGD